MALTPNYICQYKINNLIKAELELVTTLSGGTDSQVPTAAAVENQSKLSWWALAMSYTVKPTLETYTGGDGKVRLYTYGSTVLYRFSPTSKDPLFDQFFTTFSDPTLSGLVATKGQSI